MSATTTNQKVRTRSGNSGADQDPSPIKEQIVSQSTETPVKVHPRGCDVARCHADEHSQDVFHWFTPQKIEGEFTEAEIIGCVAEYTDGNLTHIEGTVQVVDHRETTLTIAEAKLYAEVLLRTAEAVERSVIEAESGVPMGTGR